MSIEREQDKKRERSPIPTTSSTEKVKIQKANVQPNVNLQIEKATARTMFDAERANILESLTTDYRTMFGQIGFCPFGSGKKKSLLPVLILDPFDVPPRPVREEWLQMYREKKSRGELDQLNYLVFWYGTEKDSEFYGFKIRKSFVPYETEKMKPKSVCKLPEKLQLKVESSQMLTLKESLIVRRYEDLQHDLLLQPNERKRGLIDFDERHDLIGTPGWCADDCQGVDGIVTPAVE